MLAVTCEELVAHQMEKREKALKMISMRDCMYNSCNHNFYSCFNLLCFMSFFFCVIFYIDLLIIYICYKYE